jgi:hypothetical protein
MAFQHPWLLLAVVCVVLTVWGFVDVYQRGKIDPKDVSMHKTDLTVYTEAGAAFFDGRKPYDVTNPRGWGYLYLPLFAMLIAPLHALAGEWQVTVWFFLSVGTLAGCYLEMVRIADLCVGSEERSRLFPGWMVGAAIACVSLPTFNCLQRGQVGVLQLWLLLAGARLAISAGGRWRQSFVAGLVLATPIGLKLTPGLPVACLWLQRLGTDLLSAPRGQRRSRWRRILAPAGLGATGVAVGLALYVFVAPSLLVGWQKNVEFLDQWWDRVGVKTQNQTYDRFAGDSYSVRNQSLSNALHHLGNWVSYQFAGGPYDEPFENEQTFIPEFVTDTPAFEAFIAAARLTLVIVAICLSLWGTRSRDPLLGASVFGLTSVAMLVAAPIARVHYFVFLLPAALFVPAAVARAGHPRMARWLAWTPVALVLTHYVLMRVVGRVGLLGIGITVWYFVAALFVAQAIWQASTPRPQAASAFSLKAPKSRRRRSRSTPMIPDYSG